MQKGGYNTVIPVARVFIGPNVAAYIVRDADGHCVELSYMEFYNMTKAGMVKDCKVSGDNISGTNGFELRKLEVITRRERTVRPVAELVLAGQMVIGYIMEYTGDGEITLGNYTYSYGDLIPITLWDTEFMGRYLYGGVLTPTHKRYSDTYYTIELPFGVNYPRFEIAEPRQGAEKPWVLKPDFWGLHTLCSLMGAFPEVAKQFEYSNKLILAYHSHERNGESGNMKLLMNGISSADNIIAIAKYNLAKDIELDRKSKNPKTAEILEHIEAGEQGTNQAGAQVEPAETTNKVKKDISKSKGIKGLFDFFKR